MTVPTACKYDYEDLMWNFPKYECINASLVASEWVKEKNKIKIDRQYWNKICTWASGVKLPEIEEHEPFKSCICYYKRLPVDNDLTQFIEVQGIKCNIVEYGSYTFDKWINMLKKTDFVIFYQDYRETQGLAMAEAWSNNVVTLIKTVDSQYCTSPYLTEQTGRTWDNIGQLKELISEYSKNPKTFLDKFSPRKYIENNMSDKVSVQNLIKIIEDVA